MNHDALRIKVNGTELQQVTHCKFLGVWLDENLNWKFHISQTSNKLSKLQVFSKY